MPPAKDLREWIDDLEENKRLKAHHGGSGLGRRDRRDHQGDIEPVWAGIVVREHQRASPDSVPPPIHQRHGDEEQVPAARSFGKPLTVIWCPSSRIASQNRCSRSP